MGNGDLEQAVLLPKRAVDNAIVFAGETVTKIGGVAKVPGEIIENLGDKIRGIPR